MVDFDSDMSRLGLPEAARRMQRHYIRDMKVFSEAPLPTGPFLAVANHPGLTDALSLFAALNREDLKIIALDRPFLKALPHTSDRLFYVKDADSTARVNLVRRVSTHLRRGGAVLTFPAGHIEPDPEAYDGALASLQTWTDSVGVFIRMAPETAVVPVVVSGVVWRAAARQPLLLVKRTRAERERLAAALQFLAHVACHVKPVTVRVQIGRPITAKALGTTDPRAIHWAVLASMTRMYSRESIA
jgi:1-acyl-sn-glycerol-3-phosphate acyltransferase